MRFYNTRFGIDNFQDALKMSSKGDLSKGLDWTKFKYMVFDIPNHQGTYQERYNQLGECGVVECRAFLY